MIFPIILVAVGMALIAANGTRRGTLAGGLLMTAGIACIALLKIKGVTP